MFVYQVDGEGVQWSPEKKFPAKGVSSSKRHVDMKETGVSVKCKWMDIVGAQETVPLLSLVIL